MKSETVNSIAEAVARYQAVQEKLQEIEEALDNFQAPLIERLTNEFNACMDKAKAADKALELLPPLVSTDRGYELHQGHRRLQEEIQRKIQAMGPRLQSMKAVQLAEMQQIKLGRQTASGYARHAGSKTGRIINSSN